MGVKKEIKNKIKSIFIEYTTIYTPITYCLGYMMIMYNIIYYTIL